VVDDDGDAFGMTGPRERMALRARGIAAGPIVLGERAMATGSRKKPARRPSMAVRKACFLDGLRRTANVSRAAREAGLCSSTVYEHRAKYPAFAAAWDAAVAEALDELEDVLIERAKHGTEKPVYFRGEQVGTVRSYSDALGMFLLKARRPEVYARLQVTVAPVDADEMTDEEARAELNRRLDRLVEDDDAA
jgi:transposase-like protein